MRSCTAAAAAAGKLEGNPWRTWRKFRDSRVRRTDGSHGTGMLQEEEILVKSPVQGIGDKRTLQRAGTPGGKTETSEPDSARGRGAKGGDRNQKTEEENREKKRDRRHIENLHRRSSGNRSGSEFTRSGNFRDSRTRNRTS